MVKPPFKLREDSKFKFRRGKVRDIVEGYDVLYLTATDRVSAFDVVMPTLIPGKGELLTKLSHFWFDYFKQIPNHLITGNTPRGWTRNFNLLSYEFDVPNALCQDYVYPANTMIVKKVNVIPVEFIVRGYMAGSLWKEYVQSGYIAAKWLDQNIKLEKGMKQCDELPEPIFTPSTKASEGHDENITFDESVGVCAKHLNWSVHAARQLMKSLAQMSIRLYSEARCHALTRGVILADTKFEFGMIDDTVVLIDELLTPDSSRYWSLKDYEPGRDQDSFDKQILRNYLQGLVDKGKWDKTAPGPEIPDDIVRRIKSRYQEIVDRLIGE